MSDHKRPAPAAVPIHDLIIHRWSPRAFEDRPVEPEKLRALFEAARWSASSYNAQPWSFIIGTKDDPENYKKVLDSFVEFNQGWAKNAPVVALSVAAHKMPHDGAQNRHAFHDVGQAAATLALQATAWDSKSIRWPESFPTKRARFSVFPKITKLSRDSPSVIPATLLHSPIRCVSAS